LITTFLDITQRARVLGLSGALLTSGFTVGALVGGTLVDWLSWRAAFFINVPVGIIILITAPFLIKESKPGQAKLDIPGAITVTAGLLAVIYAVLQKNSLSGIIGAILLIAFFLIKLPTTAP